MEVVDIQGGENGYIKLQNPNDIAIDVSGWRVNGDGFSFEFVPGTVVPANGDVYLASTSIKAFLSRPSPPTGGEGHFVVGPVSGTLSPSARQATVVRKDTGSNK